MEMGNSFSSIPCIDPPKNEGVILSQQNAVIDVVHPHTYCGDDNKNKNEQPQQTNASAVTNSNHVEAATSVSCNDNMHVKWTKAVEEVFQFINDWMFPKSLLLNHPNLHPRRRPPNSTISSRDASRENNNKSRMTNSHPSVILLRRCETLHEQNTYIQQILETCQHLHGRDGLLALGLEYRFILCDEHKSNNDDIDALCSAGTDVVENAISLNDDIRNVDGTHNVVYLSERALQQSVHTFTINDDVENCSFQPPPLEERQVTLVELAKMKSEQYLNLSNRSDSLLSDDGQSSTGSHNAEIGTTPSLATTTFTAAAVVPPPPENDQDDENDDPTDAAPDPPAKDVLTTTATPTTEGFMYQHPTKKTIVHQFCPLCERRMYDISSNMCITDQNRTEFIANGAMYELVSRLAQEYAHEIMIQEGNLIWVNIDDDAFAHDDNNHHHSNGSNNNNTPTEHCGDGPSIRINGVDDETQSIRCLMSKDHPCLRKTHSINRSLDHDHIEQYSPPNSTNDFHPDHHRPTLLICTGRGKVRAGIFSRHHLICTGLERSTALPFIHDAIHRNIYIVLFDPNVQGETHGYTIFTKSMNFLQPYYNHSSIPISDHKTESTRDGTLCHQERNVESVPHPPYCRDMYILSHSASGGHLVRYFLDKCHTPYVRNIRAIAFTDSTHSIQWAKGTHQTNWYDFLQSLRCIYFRCSSSTRDTIAGDGDSKWYLHPAGEDVQTDSFWRHRFGKIRTVWAGTNEHSQTNWFAQAKIWEHFDQFLFS